MKIIISFLISAFTFGFFYLLGSFYNISFNISEWSDYSRYSVSFLGGMFSPILSFVKPNLL